MTDQPENRPEPEPLVELPDPLADVDADPALASAVLEIEQHLADGGWDQPARLYALVPTADLVAQEPALAHAMGLDAAAEQGSLTAVEQDQVAPGAVFEQVLGEIVWPESVAGCAVMVERFVLPPGADSELPADPGAQRAFVREHPDRQEVRIVAGVTRDGGSYCALRLRSHDDAASVVGGVDTVPGLLALLRETLADDVSTDPQRDPQRDPRNDPQTDTELS